MTVVTEGSERTQEERISESPWNGDSGRFTDEQYQRSCVLDRKGCGSDWAEKPPKSRCALPIREPGGDLSRAGVHAAASRVNSVKNACPSVIASAKAKLRAAYKQLGEDVPDGLKSDEAKSTELDAFVERFGVIPGVARHNVEGYRGVMPFEFVRAEDEESNGIGLLNGHFAVFSRFTEIDSFFEGRFMEQIAPGAFKKTFKENGANIRCMFNHGRDPAIGMKVLGTPRTLAEDGTGARYEVPLDDTSFNRDLLPGLRGGQYGASFRFRVIREEVNTKPGRSSHNPEGIEERTIVEAAVSEFGPVSFPAYQEASAGVRMRSVLPEQLSVEMGGEAAYVAMTRSGPYHPYHFFFDLEDRAGVASDSPSRECGEGSEEDGSSPEAPAGEHQEEAGEPAPSEDAPGRDYLRSTRLPSAARKPLRTTQRLEVPSWKL